MISWPQVHFMRSTHGCVVLTASMIGSYPIGGGSNPLTPTSVALKTGPHKLAPMVYGLRRGPFKSENGVRIPVGVLNNCPCGGIPTFAS